MKLRWVKRVLVWSILVLLITCMMSACEEEHKHVEVINAAVAPTCTTAGQSEGKYCADCGDVIVASRSIPALGHQEVENAAVAPTCSRTGLSAGKYCARCQTEIGRAHV